MTSLTPLQWIAKIAPDYDTNVSDDIKNAFIEVGKSETRRDMFSSQTIYNLAVAYYACHQIWTIELGGDQQGVLTGRKEGSVAIYYSNGGAGTDHTKSTYLIEYEKLVKPRSPSFISTSGVLDAKNAL